MIQKPTGLLITVEGIDGSGKNKIIEACSDLLNQLKIVDLRNDLGGPSFRPVPYADVIILCEPAKGSLGRFITDKLIYEGEMHLAKTVIDAFAYDRQILYKELIWPALGIGKLVIKDRGLASSLTYQPLQAEFQGEDLDLDYILNLEGNKMALEAAPDLLVIADIPAEISIKRLKARRKKDNSIFDTIEFQTKLGERYRSSWLRELYEERGTKVIYVDTSGEEDGTKQRASGILEEFLKEKNFIY